MSATKRDGGRGVWVYGMNSNLEQAVSNAPTDVLERELRRIKADFQEAVAEIMRTSWGGISRGSAVAYHRAVARKRLAEVEFRLVNGELERRRLEGENV